MPKLETLLSEELRGGTLTVNHRLVNQVVMTYDPHGQFTLKDIDNYSYTFMAQDVTPVNGAAVLRDWLGREVTVNFLSLTADTSGFDRRNEGLQP